MTVGLNRASRMNVILDLDQTLISGEDVESIGHVKAQKLAEKFRCEVFKDEDGTPLYYIYERPYLQEFLDFLFATFNVSVWTAATSDYAIFVIKKFILIPNKPYRKLDFIFTKDHVAVSQKAYKTQKKLDYVYQVTSMYGSTMKSFSLHEQNREYGCPTYDKSNTVILDDNEEVRDAQPSNCIPAEPFYVTSSDAQHDTFLATVAKTLYNRFYFSPNNVHHQQQQQRIYSNNNL